jgi:hypothetical protein
MELMLHDLRLAARRVVHERRFAAAVAAVLALGIGINAFGFSVIYAVYFRPLPFANPDRLHMIAWETAPNRHTDPSYDEFQAWRSANRAFDDLAAFRNSTVRVSDGRGYAQEAPATAVTANAFPLLGLESMKNW